MRRVIWIFSCLGLKGIRSEVIMKQSSMCTADEADLVIYVFHLHRALN